MTNWDAEHVVMLAKAGFKVDIRLLCQAQQRRSLCMALGLSSTLSLPAAAPGLRAIAPLSAELTDLRARSMLVLMQGTKAAQLNGTYTQARANGTLHDALDIMAPAARRCWRLTTAASQNCFSASLAASRCTSSTPRANVPITTPISMAMPVAFRKAPCCAKAR